MNTFVPFRMYRSPFFTAVVRMLAASDPAWGSVRAKAPSHSPVASFGTYRFFCSAVPKVRIGYVATEVCTERMTPTAGLTLEISSMARM